MLKTSLSPNSKREKRRQLLSLNRPHSVTLKLFDDATTTQQSAVPKPGSPTPTSPPIPWSQDAVEPQPTSTESTDTTLGEYHCPICSKDLSTFNTSFSRQQHIDVCLSSTDDGGMDVESAIIGDDQSLESLFMDYCSFCGKSISHLKGVQKERHFDQCLTTLENEQLQAEQHKQRTTYAGQSIPFLQDLDICPVCHDDLPGPSLRSKISHLKRCAKQRSLTMQQLLRKIQWMQWGHLPIQNTSSARETTTDSSVGSSSITTAPPISYSRHATELPPANDNTMATIRSTPSLTIKKGATPTDYTSSEPTLDMDDDFTSDVLIYKVATWQQTRFKKAKQQPTEDESIAMALSLSLMDEGDQSPSKRPLSRRKKRKVNLDATNIVSIEESRALAKLALEKLFEKHSHECPSAGSSTTRFPLVTSHVQSTLSQRQNSSSEPLSTSSTSLWSQASCLD